MRHPLYKTWCEMRYRCEDHKKMNYKYYGGRGIKVCERWRRFGNFVEDMGNKPKGTSLGRIDNNGNYEPSNCRWESKLQQANNTSFNRILMVEGKPFTLSEASRVWHVPFRTIWRRLELGWGVEDAVKRTVRKHKIYKNSEHIRRKIK